MAITGIGDNDDRTAVLNDARAFFCQWFPLETDQLEADETEQGFVNRTPQYWWVGEKTAALVQVYDLVAPLDQDLARTYLRRLGSIVGALLDRRDDKWPVGERKVDAFRRIVMPAWGQIESNRDNKWNTDVDTSGLFVYPMAAFARRVARNPAYHPEFGAEAVRMITAVIETYQAFRRDELNVKETDPHAYFKQPEAYELLSCDDNETCEKIRALAGKPLPYNQNLSMLQALAELALAADSAWYRGSADATPERLRVATEEAPLVIAKGIAFFADHLRRETLDDGSPYFQWNREQPRDRIEDTAHGGFSLGALAVILEEHVALNQLLTRNGRSERIRHPSFFAPMANTFLRKVWRNNSLSHDVDGDGEGDRRECTGWIPFSQFDPWVWKRAREAVFHDPPRLFSGSHAALLRYRRFSKMKFLTQFAGQNWLITPVATAVGEPPPANIHEQRWLLVLSGVVIADQRGDNSGNWNHQTVSFMPDMAGSDAPGATSGPLNWAIQRWRIPKPSGAQGSQYLIRFSVEEWSPFASPNAMLNLGESINSGFAVDSWRPNNFGRATNVLTNQPVGNLFSGVNVDLAVRDNDAWLHRLGYNITLIGRIVFINVPLT